MDFQEIIEQLPPWLQVIIVILIIFAGVVFGKKRHAKTTQKSYKKPSPQKVSSLEKIFSEKVVDLKPEAARKLKIVYDPNIDGTPDPGEVVWLWVPFVEMDGRGKDRPVLIIARLDAKNVAGCYMSTKEHRGFIDVGSGPWDGKGRRSYLNPNRVLEISESAMRREGSVMPRSTFERVVKHI